MKELKYQPLWRRTHNVFLGNQRQPTKPELQLLHLLEVLLPYQWKYVGDGQLIIGGKCPDFMNINGKKQLIELYGDFWHRGQNPDDRVCFFNGYGYQTLIVWEAELEVGNEERLANKLIAFARR